MIIEVQDIVGKGEEFAHIALPEGYTLGDVFTMDDSLKKFQDHIVQVTVNGVNCPEWRSLNPGKNERVKFFHVPADPISIILAVISVVRFIIGLFNQPKPPQLEQGPKKSKVFTFEGLQNGFAPGDVLPVTYGVHRIGGQVLMFHVDVRDDRKGQEMGMLVSLGHGEVSCITCVKINNLFATEVPSLTIQTRLGGTSQSVMDGFDVIKNTFADGRDVSTGSIIYTTTTKICESVDLQVLAPNGLSARVAKGTHPERFENQFVIYTIETRPTGEGGDFTLVDSRRFTGAQLDKIFDVRAVTFPALGQWDIRLRWVDAAHTSSNKNAITDIILQNVTEFEQLSGRLDSLAYSGEALLGIRGAATEQLQGGRPIVTSLLYGRTVKVFDSVDSSIIEWSQNPAWAMIDYLTNSVYGTGRYIEEGDVDIQSFIDFGTLCDSSVNICPA